MPTVDHLATFPIQGAALTPRLRTLLSPIGLDPLEQVDVTTDLEFDNHGPNGEYVHMLMAVVPETVESPVPILNEAAGGVVSSSVPVLGNKGLSAEFAPSMSGYDYIVASWGDGSHYTYALAEKVWMALGLSPRCLGNEQQRIVYDDLGIPEFAVAEGEIAREYHYKSSRNVTWRMSNAHLRKYLWMRGARGVRSFYYQASLPDSPELRHFMGGQRHIDLKSDLGWYQIDIQEQRGRLLLQVWASVDAVSCEMCPERSADNIVWFGVEGPVTHASANADRDHHVIYLDDRFLDRYEQSSFYDTTPVFAHGQWLCSPSYRGQWSFSDCRRIGRNLIRVRLRELYKPKPEQEILHAHSFALDQVLAAQFDPNEEHIAAKTQRFVFALLTLGDNLSRLGAIVGEDKSVEELVGFSATEIRDNGWLHYPKLSRLAQVAPLSMSEQEFLGRCKSLHEIWQKLPNGFLKRILQAAGCPKGETDKLGSVKLLQALLNVAEKLDVQDEDANAFNSSDVPEGWNEPNERLSALFVAYDLRIADAHETFALALPRLQDLGFDTASLQQGYGRAIDFVMDKVIEAFENINGPLSRILAR
ncbi:putative bpiB05 (plasmid) [Paraburkholderia fungorum]|jgi:hypothetical protein|uniref:BpiB05 n=1 Tax=Paraburkholderia fungorum TaxID=134537 RepID=A0AAU8SRX7_9BURK|nr:hypothetical protein [Paraburkholderia fungorum]AJZ56144.1 putative bpiB05 [Paraburkholderia fungorum]MBU7440737.1 hypothetical protein [Paraburkholderia fungorum]PNE59357.1 hypothetical protein A8H39_03280 [Paraburkholderia fungorum]QLD54165.1 hypothetical protein C9419_34615 [Paraburkholderia fungorum]